ncbi:MAG TPA: LLM class flavin-dependent oxidoreductase [Gammaproteobacteria bacterium]|nr:LLM class flavin-dependent oxidoreductase [Gammaproteobacteria bacterium]
MSARLGFGLWYSLRNPARWARPITEIYAQTLRQIAWAETIGYDDVWLTEHHFCDDGHAPSILPLAAAVAARTARIRIGTSVLLLPLHHPVRVAEDAATIDILSHGRFELGVGVGYRPQEFSGLGLSVRDRGGRMDEGLDIIRALWRGETVDYRGRHFTIEGAKLAPLPVQSPPPLWIGGFAPVSARRAARIGDGYLGTGEMGKLLKIYREERARLGHAGPGRAIGGHFWLIVSKDPKRTLAALGPHVLYQIEVYNRWLAEAGQALFPPVSSPADLVDRGILQILRPAQAVDVIGAYAEATGIERYYTWTVPPGYPEEQMDEHLQRFAEDVIPQFR